MSANQVVFIIPYYGRIPVYFDNWKHTALQNPGFDFLFFTDLPEISEEANIHVVRLSLHKLRTLFRKKLGYPARLRDPYKLCDYKPAYGFLFEEYIRDYRFWGYCDIDTLLGDLAAFLTKDRLKRYDKIYELGHMTLYRNTPENNAAFLSEGPYPEFNSEFVYRSDESWYFDEFYGMMLKSRRLGTKTCLSRRDFADLDTSRLGFFDVADRTRELYFAYLGGKLFAVGTEDNSFREIAYVHFQKRNLTYMRGMFDTPGALYIFPRSVLIVNESNRCRFHSFTIKAAHGRTEVIRRFAACIRREETSQNAGSLFASHKSGRGKDTSLPERPEKLPKLSPISRAAYRLRHKLDHVRDFGKRYLRARKAYPSVLAYYRSRQNLKKRRASANRIIENLP